MSPSHVDVHAHSAEDVEERAQVLATARPCRVTSPPVTAAATTNVPASMRSGDDPVLRAPEAPAALHLDGVGGRPLDLGAHLLQERDEVVHLGLLGGRPDGRVAVGERRREERVLGAHHGHVRERRRRAPRSRPGERAK